MHYNGVEIKINCNVVSENGFIIIGFFITDPQQVLTSLNREQRTTLTKAHRNYFENKRIDMIKDADLQNKSKFNLVQKIFSAFVEVWQARNQLNLLSNFKKRIIFTSYGYDMLVATTVMSINADVVTVISKKLNSSEQFLADLHFSHLNFSESVISDRLTKFLSGLSWFGYFVSVIPAVLIPAYYLLSSQHALFDYNSIPLLVKDTIVLLVSPTMFIKFGRKIAMKLFFRYVHKYLSGWI